MRMRWLDRFVLPLCCLALGPMLVYGSNATTPIVVLLALLYLGRAGLSLPGMWRSRQQAWWLPLTFLVLWAATSSAWSIRPINDFASALQLAAMMVAGVLVVRGVGTAHPEDARRAGWFLPLAVILAVVIALFEIAADFPVTRRLLAEPPDYLGPDHLFQNNIARGMPAMLLLLWPAAYLLAVIQGRRLAATVLILLAAAVILVLPMGATKLALFLSALLGGLALWRPRAAIVLTAGLAVCLGVAAIGLLALTPPGWPANAAAGLLPDSWTHRLVIWQSVTEHVGKRPMVGFGFDASRRLDAALADGGIPLPQGLSGNVAQRLPLHPHSMPLQVWLELGVIALLALALSILGSLRLIWRMAGDRSGAAMALATFVAWLTISCLSFGAWQSWWLAAGWLAATSVVLVRRCLAGEPAAAGPGQSPAAGRGGAGTIPFSADGSAAKLSSRASPPSSAAGTMV